MKRIFSLLIAACFCLSAHAQWDGTSAPWTQGNGTQANPYQISSAAHLAYLSDMVSGGVSSYQNQYFLLTQDISLSNQPWIPIGDETNPFKGHFNGGGHLIDSVYVSSDITSRGLFGCITGAVISEITCRVSIGGANTSSWEFAGGITGLQKGGIIDNCKVYGSVSGMCCGGIVGRTSSYYDGSYHTSRIQNCENHATVTSVCLNAYIGGIVGETYSGRTTIVRSGNYGSFYYNRSNIECNLYAGGIMGLNNDYDTIMMCFNSGDFSIAAKFIGYNNYTYYCRLGGICGGTYNSSTNNNRLISYCYNTGNVSLSNQNGNSYYVYVSGIAYQCGTNCYNVGSITTSTANYNYGVGSTCGGNNYYINTIATNGCGSARTEANMKSVSFPVMLNTDSTVFVVDELGINGGYPVFAYQTIYNIGSDSVSGVTSYAAQLNGHYSGTADSAGFLWWQVGDNDTILVPLVTASSLQYTLTGLQPNTTYGYKIYVKRSGHTVYGSAVTFATHPLYTVSVATSNSAWGSVSGGGTFAYGETATLTATAATENYRFMQWSDGNTQNPRILTVTQNVSITAQFGPAIYTVTVTSANSAWGSVSGGGSFDYGQSVTITATAATGYHFVQWSDGNVSNPRTIVVIGDINLTATFAPNQYTVTALSNNSAWGTVSGSGSYAYNSIDTLTATPFTNYRFLQWNDGIISNPRHLVVTGDTSLTAQFGPAIYNVTVTSANMAWGTVSGSGSFNYGQSATITATAAAGYHFVQWNDGDVSNPRSVVVSGDMTFTATFAPNQYTVTVLSNNSAWGSVSGSGNFAYGSIDTLTAIPYGNYIFGQWSDGVTSNPRYLLVTGDTTLTAQFSPGNCTLTLFSNNSAWGTVSGAGTYAYGTSVTCTAIPEEHYHFVSWDDGNTSNPRAYILTGDNTLTATFAPNQHTVTVLSSNSSWGTVSGNGTYGYGTIDTLRATPYTNYVFQQWSDGNSENPRYLTVTNDTMFTAQFALRTYLVVLSSNNTAWGTVSGGGTYNYGQTVLCTAIPTSGYHFVQWSNGNTSNPYIITADSNISLTAQFAPDQYTITVTSNDTTKGTVSGGGTYDYGQQIYIIAVAKPSYSFSQWSDGNTNAYRQLTVTQNISFTAVFTDAYFTITTQSNNDAYGIVTGGGSYANGSTVTLTAIANNGYHFVQWSDGVTDNPRTVTVTSNATYYAQFAINNYTINAVPSDVSMGSVTGGGIYTYLTQVTLQATPTQNHRFVQWNDGSTSNPRVITVVSDSNFTAQFEQIEQYTVTVVSDNPQRGTVSGGGTFYVGTMTQISATALPNNVFVRWSDGSTESHRTVTVTGDVTYTAYFDAMRYQVNVYSNDDNMGSVSGGGSYEYGSQATVTATPAAGCHFVRWNNGVETNPYTFTVTSDVNLIANFERNAGIEEGEYARYVITTQGNSLNIVGAEGESVYVSDMLGRKVFEATVSQPSQTVQLPSTGVYIVRIGKTFSKKIVVI